MEVNTGSLIIDAILGVEAVDLFGGSFAGLAGIKGVLSYLLGNRCRYAS